MKTLRISVVGLLLAASAWAAVPAAQATFPGADGLVALGITQGQGSNFRIPLFTMKPDGTGVKRLTDPASGELDGSPAWSPDNKTVAFTRTDANGNDNVYTVRVNGTGLKQLTSCTTQPDPCGDNDPTYTPDGNWIVFSHCCVRGNGGFLVGLSRMHPDGTHVERITLNPDVDFGDFVSTVSPDGNWIAFSRAVGRNVPDPGAHDPNAALFLVHPDGSDLHRITSYKLKVDEKDFSPDGSRIVFTAHRGTNDTNFRADIFTIAPDGSDLQQLTHNTINESFSFFPTYSPSGDLIMFDQFPSGKCGIDTFTMKPDGSKTRQVTNSNQCEQWLRWGSAEPSDR